MMSSKELEQWKKKYLLKLDEIDKAKVSWRDLELLLKLSVSRVSAAAVNIDDQLDQSLSRLKDVLREDKIDQNSLKRILEAIATRVQQLDNIQSQKLQHRKVTVNRIVDSLEALPLAEKGQLLLKQLEDNVQKELDNVDNLLIGIGATLENQNSPPAVSSIEQISDAKPEEQTAITPEPSEISELYREVHGHALRVLDHLSIPNPLKPKLKQLQDRFHVEREAEQLPELMDSLVLLVMEASRVEQQQFEQFAEVMVQRFSQVEDFLDRVTANEASADMLSEELDSDMRGHFDGMISDVREATNLGELQTSMESHIGTIFNRLDQFKHESLKRKQELEAELKVVNDNLAKTKHETLNLKKMLSDQEAKGLEDPLTGLGNRRAYEKRITEDVSRWERYQTPLSLIVCDLDHFKLINDNYGHQAGDKVLRVISKLLVQHTRQSDFVGRYGGEEFVILLPNTDLEVAEGVAEKLRTTIAELPFESGGKKVHITISLGLTSAQSGDTVASLFKRADDLLYQAKHAGRNCIKLA